MGLPALSGKAQTVLGPIHPDALGITLMHEHLVIDVGCYFEEPSEASERAYIHKPVTMDILGALPQRWYYSLDTVQLWDVDAAIHEASLFKYAGGHSIVDVTSLGIGRDPLALARISRATGLNIVMGGSYYVPASHPSDMDDKTEEAITAEIVRDITVGVGETGVRAGMIGEVGNFFPLSDNERKVLQASAQAQAETGAPISIHPGMNDWAPLEIVELLVNAGAEADRIVLDHLGPVVRDRKALKELAETGCFLEYDHFGAYEDTSIRYRNETDFAVSDVQVVDALEFLVADGHLGQILLSHDVNFKYQHTRFGRKGIAHILDSMVPRMRRRGFAEDQINAMLIDNPRRALTFR